MYHYQVGNRGYDSMEPVAGEPKCRGCGKPESLCKCCSWCQSPRCEPCPDCSGALCMGNGYVQHHGRRCHGARL